MSLNNWDSMKMAIKDVKTDADVMKCVSLIENEIIRDEDFIRINYNMLVTSLVDIIRRSDSHVTLAKIFCLLSRIFTYTFNHPSLQRKMTLNQVKSLVVELDQIGGKEVDNSVMNTLNVLTRCIKHAIKVLINNNSGENDLKKDEVDESCHQALITDIIKSILTHLTLHVQYNHKQSSSGAEDLVWPHMSLDLLRSLNMMLTHFKSSLSSVTNDNSLCCHLLSVLRMYSFHGMPGFNINKMLSSSIYQMPIANIPEATHITPSAKTTSKANKRSNKKSSKSKSNKSGNKGKRVNDDDDEEDFGLFPDLSSPPHNSSASESEFSDLELNPSGLNPIDLTRAVRNVSTKIRLISYECLTTTVKMFDKKIIFGFWSAFIPDSSIPSLNLNFNLFSTILKDASPKVRVSALNFMRELLSSGGQFVKALAENRSRQANKQMSFTPISVTIASMIAELHRCICLVLFAETNTHVLLPSFKCMSLLVNCTPYNKLNPSLLTTLCHKMSFLLNHKDIQIENSCLVIYDGIFNLDPLPSEILEWIESGEGEEFYNKLITYCVMHIEDTSSIILTGASLKLLTALFQSSIALVTLKNVPIDKVLSLSEKCILDELVLENQVIQSLVCKFVFSIGVTLKNHSSNLAIEEATVFKWWNSCLNSQLIMNGLRMQVDVITSSAISIIIDFISNIPPQIFQQNSSLQYLLITLLFSITKSSDDALREEYGVRASAIRCLGVFQAFPSLSEDLSFLIDVCYACKDIIIEISSCLTKKDSHSLLNQATWTLGNAADVLRKNPHTSDIGFDFMNSLIKVSLNTFDLHLPGIHGDNIKTNCTRALSNSLLLMLESQHQKNDCIKGYVSSCVSKLTLCFRNCRSFKLHWNICYAFSSFLSNEGFIRICDCTKSSEVNVMLIEELRNSLLTLMKASKNHKVQCYALDALCACYSSHVEDVDVNYICKLWWQIIEFMLDNYSHVPNQLKHNWLYKMCDSLIKLYDKTCINSTNSPEYSDKLIQVKDFLQNLPTEEKCDSSEDLLKHLILL